MDDSTKYTLLSLLALAALFLLWPRASAPDTSVDTPAPQIIISFEPSSAFENQTVQVYAALPPSCPGREGLTLTLDNMPVNFNLSDHLLSASVSALSGAHRVQLSGASCSVVNVLHVSPRPCTEGATRACTDSIHCAGQSVCAGGAWNACRVPPRICDPGTRIPCSTDSCKWGFSNCNSCGTQWGECLPP